jgi:hypothetical protein
MRETRNRPSWWLLYLLGLAMVGLLVLGARAHLSERGHEAAAIGALVLAFGLVELWLRSNSAALLFTDRLTLARQPRPESWDAQDAEHTAVLVSWLEPQEAEIPLQAGGTQTPQEQTE